MMTLKTLMALTFSRHKEERISSIRMSQQRVKWEQGETERMHGTHMRDTGDQTVQLRVLKRAWRTGGLGRVLL